MAFLGFVVILMAMTNNSSMMTFVGLICYLVIVPILYVASKRLRTLLAKGAPPKPGTFDIR